MKSEVQAIIAGTIFILFFGMASHALISNSSERTVETAYGSWSCTADIQVCPDGSTVARTPPYCQFAPCQ